MERTAALLTAALTFALAAGPGEAGAFDDSLDMFRRLAAADTGG